MQAYVLKPDWFWERLKDEGWVKDTAMFWLILKVLEITVKDGQRLQGKQSMYNEFPKIKFIQRRKVYP